MPKILRGAVITLCLVTASCQSQRSVLYHGAAKTNYLTPTRGSVLVQTPTMLPPGMARAANPGSQPTATIAPNAAYAFRESQAPAEPRAPEVTSGASPSSNASAAAPTEVARAPGPEPLVPPATTPSPAEKYQPAYPPLTEPQASARSGSRSTNAAPFDAPMAAPNRTGMIASELSPPVATSSSDAAIPSSAAAPFVPPTSTTTGTGASRTGPSSRTSSSLIEELRPPR